MSLMNKKIVQTCVVLFIVSAVIGSVVHRAEAEDDFFETKVQKVLSGDRIMLRGGTIVQYYGVEVPALNHSDSRLSDVARLALKENERIVKDKTIRIEFAEVDDDTSSIKQAYVFASGVLVNGHLLKNGLALVSQGYDTKQKYYSYFMAAQKAARSAKRGMWGL